MRSAVALACVVGGLCWIAGAWVSVLVWVGAVLLAIAVLGAGAALVSRTATWLRAVVAVCFLALVASLLSLLRDHVDHQVLLVLVGAVAVVVGSVVLARRPADTSRHRGAHAG